MSKGDGEAIQSHSRLLQLLQPEQCEQACKSTPLIVLQYCRRLMNIKTSELFLLAWLEKMLKLRQEMQLVSVKWPVYWRACRILCKISKTCYSDCGLFFETKRPSCWMVLVILRHVNIIRDTPTKLQGWSTSGWPCELLMTNFFHIFGECHGTSQLSSQRRFMNCLWYKEVVCRCTTTGYHSMTCCRVSVSETRCFWWMWYCIF